jgi:hypothetical protein
LQFWEEIGGHVWVKIADGMVRYASWKAYYKLSERRNNLHAMKKHIICEVKPAE